MSILPSKPFSWPGLGLSSSPSGSLALSLIPHLILAHSPLVQSRLHLIWLVLISLLDSSIQLTHHHDDAGSTHLWNIGLFLRDYMVPLPRRLSSSYLPKWEPEISLPLNTLNWKILALFIRYFSQA
jgi:hypothetical protein